MYKSLLVEFGNQDFDHNSIVNLSQYPIVIVNHSSYEKKFNTLVFKSIIHINKYSNLNNKHNVKKQKTEINHVCFECVNLSSSWL